MHHRGFPSHALVVRELQDDFRPPVHGQDDRVGERQLYVFLFETVARDVHLYSEIKWPCELSVGNHPAREGLRRQGQ